MDELERVERAAEDASLARQVLEDAMREAWKKYPLREIARVAGISHEQVRRIVRQDPGRDVNFPD